MNDPNTSWLRLARLARQVPGGPAAVAPFGFASRLAARWARGEGGAPSLWDVWELCSRRSLALAAVLMLTAVAVSYDVAAPGWTHQYNVADATFDPLFEP